MKALVLSHTSDLAGAEKSMLALFDHWRKTANLEAEFIIRKPVLNLASELDKRGYIYHPLYYTNWAQREPSNDPLEIYWYAKQNTKAVAAIEALIKKVQPDVVMTNTIVAPWAAIAANNLRVPHIWFIREYGDIDHDFAFRIGQPKTFQNIGELSKLVVANSESLADFAAKYIDKTKLTVLYPFLETNNIDQLAENKVQSPFKDVSSLKLVMTGRIAPSKGQQTAAAAVGILNKQGVACELCIIGSPSNEGDSKTLQDTISSYDITDKVHLIGQQSNPFPFIKLADVGVMASDKEAFGRATLEYITLSKAVVGANSGATPELIKNGVNGFLFKPKDENDLAKALLQYAKNRELVRIHGQAARQAVQKLSKSQHTPEQLYQKIVNELADHSDSNQSKKPVTDLIGYPVLLRSGDPKPKLPFSLKRIITATKLLLKDLYLSVR